MRNKLGTLCISIGTVFVLMALSLLLFNRWESDQAGRRAEGIAAKLEGQLQNSPTESDLFANIVSPLMSEVEIDGHWYIGTLDIPELDLSLPVMSTWNYEQLKIAPCRYSGSTKTDDIVIAAHNYIQHFGRLKYLSEGDKIYFTDMDGVRNKYVVVAIEVLQPTAVKEMNAGEYDFTLFTCTYGGRSRMAIRCDRIDTTQENNKK